ncbi:MAG TPA: aroma-sacti cluster domain-containing protein [Limnobacter sp.]|uniref:aroma-sacti cluster domain-containing protein n=1 Tax=Limnobacter sp. TaxID=2003368 RepID=UPI002ED995ED
MSDEKLSSARAIRVRTTGAAFQVDALNDTLKAQVALLDDDELAVLGAIKSKLNQGLDEKLKRAADTVGGFVW